MQRREITERKKLEMQMEDYFASADRIRKMECGGITEINGSQNCPTIDGLARFAVDQNNKKVVPKKEFVKVVSAKQKLVAGMLYYITLEAKVGEKVNVYEAQIWDRPWLDLKELTEFKRVDDDPSTDSFDRSYQIGDQFF
ncbi:cysteine protease inhibitor cystatin [Medicago truncatula]|nr:cysteine protease inhibitor cystatin [Medicago truncatula]KEH33758.1 cysteine protease inhibitor cystatin [Medicago truncatula]